MGWKWRKVIFQQLYILKRNSLSSQAYNGVKNVSMFVVSLIVKLSHKVH